ncbi:MAG: insulinase family protein [Planctomycetes bacterium]|nr:insulinase family protein [Planctomycetota bacterium]
MSRVLLVGILACTPVLGAPEDAARDDPFRGLSERVREHTLANGMRFLVLPRTHAPVVSFHVTAAVGAANEPSGLSGISHVLEHMAFKGTRTIGTRDWAREEPLLARLDELAAALRAERGRGRDADPAVIATLEAEFAEVQEKAKGYVISNDFADRLVREGGWRTNAFTGADATHYVTSLPSNKIELWFSMESDRFVSPVFREFYSEMEVIREERRMRTDVRPTGRLFEDFQAIAFKAHPYGKPTIGFDSDLRWLTRDDVEAYFRRYYGGRNLVAAIVGDVDPDRAFALAERYFGRLPAGDPARPPHTEEPESWGERRVRIEARAQPVLLVGFHRPAVSHPDDLALDGVADVLAGGRTSRLYERLVKRDRIAAMVRAFNGMPGYRYPCLFVIYAMPAAGHTADECLTAIDEEIDRLRAEPPTDDEAARFRRSFRKGWLDGMKENADIASHLATHQVFLGDWREFFRQFVRIESVGPSEIQGAAQAYLDRRNRVVGEIVPSADEAGERPVGKEVAP